MCYVYIYIYDVYIYIYIYYVYIYIYIERERDCFRDLLGLRRHELLVDLDGVLLGADDLRQKTTSYSTINVVAYDVMSHNIA